MLECGSTCGPCSSSVTIYKNRDKTLRFRFYSSIDLTAAKIWFSVKALGKDADADAVITKMSANLPGGSDAQAKVITGFATDPDTGCTYSVLEIYIVPVDTVDLDAGDYVYDVVVENNAGRRLQAVEPAQFYIKQPVTQTPNP